MDDRAIGIFDSGLGGLTVSRAILELLPNERIFYFGDTARLPYGSKSPETVLRFSEENVRFLLGKDVKCIVIACNTATAIALPQLAKQFPIPFLGVIEAGAERAASCTKNGRIGVIGTERTIASGAYSAALRARNPNLSVIEKACPLLVPLIEEGWVAHEAARLVVREYLDPLEAAGIDTLILGCTHYPLLAERIRACYPQITLVDSAFSSARALSLMLRERRLESGGSADGRMEAGLRRGAITVWVSDYSATFHKMAEGILQSSLDGVIFSMDAEMNG
ncbi:MAG: glutamate racemase [Spirochaetota bacterium]|nr:glutamate racemase [Spirochaetota bacterium]